MKKILPIAFSILCFASCNTDKNKSFKVMTWNIWHGGLHGTKMEEYKKDSLNPFNVLKVLEQHKPDILFMQETYCCGMEMAKKAGYKYSWRGSSNLSIHSNYPILDTIPLFKPFNSHGVVLNVNKKKLLCVNVWLDYRPDYFKYFDQLTIDSMIAGEKATRLKEIEAITKSVDSLRKALEIPVVIGGDFNSSSHLDWSETTKQLHFDKVIEWPVTKHMEDNGYTDSFREVNADITASLEGTWGFLGNEGSLFSDRIDYLFYKGDELKVKHSKIIGKDPPNGFFNSDHRAILTQFEFKN